MMLSQGSCFLRALGVQFFLTLAMLLPLALLLGSIYLYTLKMEESLIESYLMILTIIIMLVASFYCAIYQQLILFFLVDKKETLLVTTRKVMNFTKGVKLRLLLFFLLNTMVLLSGFILFGIGVLLTVQLNALAMTSVYKQLSVEHAVEQEEESHPQ
jgi:hypothetical protein